MNHAIYAKILRDIFISYHNMDIFHKAPLVFEQTDIKAALIWQKWVDHLSEVQQVKSLPHSDNKIILKIKEGKYRLVQIDNHEVHLV